jgi:hypothetical protein
MDCAASEHVFAWVTAWMPAGLVVAWQLIRKGRLSALGKTFEARPSDPPPSRAARESTSPRAQRGPESTDRRGASRGHAGSHRKGGRRERDRRSHPAAKSMVRQRNDRVDTRGPTGDRAAGGVMGLIAIVINVLGDPQLGHQVDPARRAGVRAEDRAGPRHLKPARGGDVRAPGVLALPFRAQKAGLGSIVSCPCNLGTCPTRLMA